MDWEVFLIRVWQQWYALIIFEDGFASCMQPDMQHIAWILLTEVVKVTLWNA